MTPQETNEMPRSAERSLALITAPVAALLAALLALLMPANPRLGDALNRALPSETDRRVVLVGIDDASLRDYGRVGTWPRELYGQALGTLEQAGATAVGIDVLLTDPSQNDERLKDAFSRANVVLATAPGESTLLASPEWRSPTGVSALNVSGDGIVRTFQTAYPDAAGTLQPSFARQLAVAAGRNVDLSDQPRVLRYAAPDRDRLPVIPFRDVVNGNVRYGDIQGKIVLIGLTASGTGVGGVRDVTGQTVPGTELQLRAVSSLLSAPFTTLPTWLIALLSAVIAVTAVLARGLWGFALAMAALLAAAPLWLGNILLPGVTLSLAAIIGTALVAAERWWNLRTLALRDPLTGFGNRVAFTRALEQRWATRQTRPLGLLLVDLSGFRKVNEVYGPHAGDELLRDLSGRIMQQKRRGDLIFRWGPDEFAVLLDQASAHETADVARRVQESLDRISYRDLPLRASVGAARTGEDIQTPVDLVEAASRSRYRVKYQREQRG
ncbi:MULTISPECIES: sensor domain-containing diguanylate cyclase [unclassified Deinococcus]|uniref:sensor domain-containing diguanylate cyclase n=1 Tax=unclassified Deinococcus TaxID=2623546 RepID=UPI0024DF032D|nr:CHASE2 domain-containing protein [Deinococcus sp. 43]MDK2013361.1 CHASE2 domain-containing protein [Deinococcus sp. 43]